MQLRARLFTAFICSICTESNFFRVVQRTAAPNVIVHVVKMLIPFLHVHDSDRDTAVNVR